MGKDRPDARILVSGDYPALESAFVKEVRSAREIDSFSSLLILVSSKLLGIHLRRLLAEQGTPHFNLRFQTLEEFARETGLPNLLGQGKKEIPSHGNELIIGQIARTLAGQDGHFYFHDISDHPGFHRAVLATLKDLKDACLSFGQIGRLLGEPETGKQLHLPKLRDFLQIWDSYEKRLRELGWFDESDVLTSAYQQVKESTCLKQTSRLLIYGFYDFNTVQKRLLQACFNEKGRILGRILGRCVLNCISLTSPVEANSLTKCHMPLQARLDVPGAFHHLRLGGFNKSAIFEGRDHDR